MGFSKSQMPKIFGEALGFMQSSVKWYLFLLPIRNRQIQRSFIVYYFRTTERTKYYWLLLLIVIAFISERPMMMCRHLGTLWFHFVYFHRYYINLVKSWVEDEWFVRNFWPEWFGKPHTHISEVLSKTHAHTLRRFDKFFLETSSDCRKVWTWLFVTQFCYYSSFQQWGL